jgi:antitoxin HigA-1
MAFQNGMRPVHPGEVLREDYLKPLDLAPCMLRSKAKVRGGIEPP